jgi:uncharacterized cupin superfamily protein
MPGATIRHARDFERNGGWALVRRGLGVSSFGINVVEIAPGEAIPEHDETERDQEEVFVVLGGRPTLVVDGESHPLEPDTFARVDVECRRHVVNEGDEAARVLIVSAPRTSGYQPMSWG